MAIIFDKEGTRIYGGRGRKSRKTKQMIENNEAYIQDEEGHLILYQPENNSIGVQQHESTLDQDVIQFKQEAQRIGQQHGLTLEELELRKNTHDGQIIAHLKPSSQTFVAGLDGDQCAQLMNTQTMWLLRRDLSVFDHDEVVRNMHAQLNELRLPFSGATVLNRDSNLIRDEAVNCVPGPRTREIFNELWIHGFLPPNQHSCRPSVVPIEQEPPSSNLYDDGRAWREPALVAGPRFVCDNLEDAVHLESFLQGRHGVIRIFLPYNLNLNRSHFSDEMHHHGIFDHREIPICNITREHEPWHQCLERFIEACCHVKNRFRPDLRLIIYRGGERPQEVIL